MFQNGGDGIHAEKTRAVFSECAPSTVSHHFLPPAVFIEGLPDGFRVKRLDCPAAKSQPPPDCAAQPRPGLAVRHSPTMNDQRTPVSAPACVVPAPAPRVRLVKFSSAIAPAVILLSALPLHRSLADAIFAPGDLIRGGKEDTTTATFNIGVIGTAGGVNNWPTAEDPTHIIDGVGAKYLNFGITYTGFLVQPSFNGGNGSVASSMQLWTANDSENRDLFQLRDLGKQ